MVATYFGKGVGHSIRGRIAREQGGTPWSKLPARFRRGLTAKQAQQLTISFEWHHAGKHATQTYVYYQPQVEAFWNEIDSANITVEDLFGDLPLPQHVLVARTNARDAAERTRCDITGDECYEE